MDLFLNAIIFQVGLSVYHSMTWIPARHCAESRIHVFNSNTQSTVCSSRSHCNSLCIII